MSRETEEFLQGLYPPDPEEDHEPHVNWTRGFEASPEEYEDYAARDADHSDTPSTSDWGRFWNDKG